MIALVQQNQYVNETMVWWATVMNTKEQLGELIDFVDILDIQALTVSSI